MAPPRNAPSAGRLPRAPIRSGRVCVPFGFCGIVGAMGDGGPAEASPDPVQLTQVRVREVGVPLADILDRLVHPLLLIFSTRLENSAAIDVAEQLVAGSILQLILRHDSHPPLMR